MVAVMAASAANGEAAAGGAEPDKPAVQAGHATVEVWSNLPWLSLWGRYADEIPWQYAAADAPHLTVPIDAIELGEGKFALRLRCLLTAPKDGYYLLAFEGSGNQQILLSDDATPGRVRSLWTDGHHWDDFPSGFGETLLRTEGPWRYFKAGEARFLEIRHLHSSGPNRLQLAWTLADGTRQKIPAACIANYVPPANDVTPGNGTAPDGTYGEVLKAVAGTPVKIDLKSAKALSSGWSTFDGKGATLNSPRIAPKPDLTQPALTCIFGGDIEFPFATLAAGYAVLSTQIQLCNGWGDYVHVVCQREIDGVRFDRETLTALSGSAPTFRCVTPWLAAGKHSLRLHFTRAYFEGSCRIFGLAVQELASGLARDAVRTRLSASNAFLTDRGDGPFLTSPACVEISSRTSAAPTLTAGGKEYTPQPATSNTWWADVPLPESGAALALVSHSTADATDARATACWAETRVSEHPEIYLRVGDAMRVTACPADVGAQQTDKALIVFRGKQIATPAGKPNICRFDKAGDETVEARVVPDHGEPVIARMLVHVLPRMGAVTESEWTRTDRCTLFKEFPTGAWPDGGDAVAFRANPADAGRTTGEWKVLPRMAGTWPAVWRAGATGPVLGTARVRAMELTDYNRFHGGDKSGDAADAKEFKSLLGKYCIVTGLPPGWKMSFTLADPDGTWHFLRRDPNHPATQVVNPWREGTAAVGEFWMHSDNPSGGCSGEYEVIPPEQPQ